MALIKCDVMFDTDKNDYVYVNSETGELISSPKKKTRSKKIEDTDPIAKITLLEGKYQFNNAAVQLMELEPDMKIAIKYERVNKTESPVIGTDEAWGTSTGNRLTKSYTVSCKGIQYDRLSEYGTIFIIEPHKTKDGIYTLTGDKPKEIPEEVKKEIEIPEEVPFSLDDISDDEVTSADFDFSL